MDNTPFRPTIRTQASLEDAWRRLMQPLRFDSHAVWLMLIDPAGQPVPQLIEIADTQQPPEGEDRAGLEKFLGTLVEELMPEGSRVAFLISRPGSASCGADDRAWAGALYDACRAAGVPVETVHLAAGDDVRPLPLDELGKVG